MKKYILFIFFVVVTLNFTSFVFAADRVAVITEQFNEKINGVLTPRSPEKTTKMITPDFSGEVNDHTDARLNSLEKKLFGTKKKPGGAIVELDQKVNDALAKSKELAEKALNNQSALIGAVESGNKIIEKNQGIIKENTGAFKSFNDKADTLGKKIDKKSSWGLKIIMGLAALVVILFLITLWVIRSSRIKGAEEMKIKVAEGMAPALSLINETSDNIKEVSNRVSTLEEKIVAVKKAVVPDPYTEKFCAAGENWEYDVPISARGKYVSMYAVKVDPADIPANPEDIVRTSYAEQSDIRKTSRDSLKEFKSPACRPEQKALVDYLLSTKKLRLQV